MGILLAKHQEYIVNLIRSNRLLAIATLVIGVLLLTYRLPHELIAMKLSPKELRFVTGIGALMLLAWIMANARAQAILSIAPLQFLGKISYSLYLVHLLVMLTVAQPAIHWLNVIGIEGSYSYWLALGITAVASIIVSSICFYVIEQPSIRIGAIISTKIQGARSV